MTSLLTEVFVVWAELLLLWRASSPSREDWGRRTMRGNCIKTWQITVPTHCYRKSKKSENTGLVPLYLPDCHVGESMDSNNLTLQPSAKLVVLMYNQFKFYKDNNHLLIVLSHVPINKKRFICLPNNRSDLWLS